jgi:hypothetical protein
MINTAYYIYASEHGCKGWCTSGVAQWLACWAHNPKVRGSKPRSAMAHGASMLNFRCKPPGGSSTGVSYMDKIEWEEIRQGGGIEPLHVSMPQELKSCPSTSLTHPGQHSQIASSSILELSCRCENCQDCVYCVVMQYVAHDVAWSFAALYGVVVCGCACICNVCV